MNNTLEYKYLKYKLKFLKIKNMLGGEDPKINQIVDNLFLYMNDINIVINEISTKFFNDLLKNIEDLNFNTQNGGTFKVYDNFFNKFTNISEENLNYSNLKSRYIILYNYNQLEQDDLHFQEYINKIILNQDDFNKQKKYYDTLTIEEQIIYRIHKSNSSILVNFFRKTNIIELIEYLKNLYQLRFNNNIFTKENIKLLLFNQPIIRGIELYNEYDVPLFKIFNIINKIYANVPPIENELIIYRAEKDFLGRSSIIQDQEYIFNGYTSFSSDPRVGFTFNKVLMSDETISTCPNNMNYVFRIKVPIGSKIILPAINRDIDPEFEILIKNNSSILINKITKDISLNIIRMFENDNICVKVNNLIDGHFI